MTRGATIDRAAGREPPTLFMLHFLGGSARGWQEVAERLGDRFDCVAIDLPGFGSEAGRHGFAVREMADHVAAVVRSAAPRRWIVAGHSMGAKVAAVLARRAEDGEPGLEGLSRIVLVAGSPPAPEPMEEARRTTMLGWFKGDAAASRREARGFIGEAAGDDLGPEVHERAVADLLRMNPDAWRAWLETGSREDWSHAIGLLATPALIIAGAEDGDLGPEAQARLMAPHFSLVRTEVLAGGGHLLPMERPADVARLIAEHAALDDPDDLLLPPAYRALIDSDRTSARTRAVLLERARRDSPARAPQALSEAAFATLRAVVDRVVPQEPSRSIDLAARIDAALATGAGDGWRFADLPPDRDAYAAALATLDDATWSLHGSVFAGLDAERQDAMLHGIDRGEVPGGAAAAGRLSGPQLRLWFEDLRSDAVRAYVSHPATLARIGYGGVANGGDGERKQGFVVLAAGRREPWEPEVGSRP